MTRLQRRQRRNNILAAVAFAACVLAAVGLPRWMEVVL